jgi:HlyD family secretion protein
MLPRNKLMKWVGLGVLALAVVLAYRQWIKPRAATQGATFTARRGPLEINVLQGGAIEALESQAVKCEVRGYQGVKILKIIEEGYQVTDDDVRTNKVLAELDSSELKKQITQQDITFESTLATLTDAKQAYDIQLNQNVSDVNAALQKAKFARMDFDKFMGDLAAKEIVRELGLPDELDYSLPVVVPRLAVALPTNSAAADAPPPERGGGDVFPVRAKPEGTNARPSIIDQPRRINLDFAKYTNQDLLGDGEAKQKLRKFEDELQVAHKGYSQSKTKLEGTQRLYARGFMTKTELELDEYFLESDRIKVASAQTAQALFLKYEFPKSCEEFLSKYLEAVRELDRARKGAVSKLAQAEAKWKSAEGRYNLEVRQRKDLLDQIDKCSIRAKKTGLVVFGGGNMEQFFYGGQEQVREGALVREQQPILTIPDMTKMAVKVRIHETYIKKVQKGQKVRITVEAFPDKKLTGVVSKVGVLPDSRNMWMNPDMKVYVTTITIDGIHEWLKPGMSVKVEIMVKTLPDVVYVPIQAVQPVEDRHYCLVEVGGRQERRQVEAGEFNDEFIEIKKGIAAGDKVALRAPETGEKDGAGKDKEGGKDAKAKAEPDAKAAPATKPGGK